MDLAQKLTSTKHRETAGSDSYSAFEFQLMFGIELLFEKFGACDDYAILFEFHDDVAAIIGTKNPKEIEFYQVKHATGGNWTLAKIQSQKKNKTTTRDHSIIEKLYSNVVNFGQYVKQAKIVSNAYFTDFGQKKVCCFDELSDEKQEQLLQHLGKRLPAADLSTLSILGFRKTELDKSSCDDLVKGRVHTFLTSNIGTDGFNLQACTDAIVAQCRIRNKRLATEVPEDLSSIISMKGITNHDLQTWLDDINGNTVAAEWSEIQHDISADWSFQQKISVRTAYQKHKVSALDSGNDAQNEMVRCIRKCIDQIPNTVMSLSESIEQVFLSVTVQEAMISNRFTEPQTKAIIIYEIYKPEPTGTIQEISAQPEKKS